jgi:hypothetical protein
MEYKEFRNKLLKTEVPRKAKVSNSWGVYDAYKAIRKHKWYDIGRPLKEKEFYSIIRGINDLLAEEIAEGKEVVFPGRMGKLELRKVERGVSIVGGKLKNTYHINWAKTIKLWFEDKEAMANKTLIRDETDYMYFVKYTKYDAAYENQCFYEFVLNRFVKIALKKNIQEGKIDTLW